jgi:sulfonate transport system permease protein
MPSDSNILADRPATARRATDSVASERRATMRPSLEATAFARNLGGRSLPWLLPTGLVVAWYFSTRLGLIDPTFLPSPGDVVRGFWSVSQTGELWNDLGISTARAFAGLAIGGGIGFALGILNGLYPLAAKLLDTTLQMVRNIPILALIPLAILWFGIGESAKLFLISLGVFFPIYLNTYHGIRNVDVRLIEMARSYGLRGPELLFQVIFPGALPSILVGLRFALGIMWLVLIVAEMVSASSGIGYMTMNARDDMQTNIVVLGILIYALLGKLADLSAHGLERRFLRWHPSFAKSS